MAVHAAMVTRMDMEIGRIIGQLKSMGAYENTLILFASDNGASAEQIIRGDGHDKSAPPGSAKTFLCLGPGWSTAANTPHRLHKHWNHEGGISSPLIAHWPAGIEAKWRTPPRPPATSSTSPRPSSIWPAEAGRTSSTTAARFRPRPRLSLAPAFAADGTVRHDAIWWCHSGNRAIRIGDWKLVERKRRGQWELYDLSVRSRGNERSGGEASGEGRGDGR